MKNSTSQAAACLDRMELPAVFHAAERAVEIFDQDLAMVAFECHPAGKGFLDQLVGDRHFGDDDLAAAILGAPQHPQPRHSGTNSG